ncbi:nicotianamine synthase family protein [Paenibacillus septentrionalis]|uniref:Nicotianamine synthase family protein n=1 Tax=Paenibacillus septentrionalis TaxID=429342 RepID=A0ABW1V4K0_9BACL
MKVDSIDSVIYTQTDDQRRKHFIEDFIALIREANEILQKQSDLSPTNQLVADTVRRLSDQLRARYSQEEIQTILSNNYIRMNQRSLQHKLSEAECLAELEASRRICQIQLSVIDEVKKLPSWNIYMELVGKELSILHQLDIQDGRAVKTPIVFVGSGSLPLSAIILHLQGNAEVICLEIDDAAYEASCALVKSMGLSTHITILKENGADYIYSSCSLIFVASLVRNKGEVLEQIKRTASDPLVAIRTAEGIKQIMYESIDESQLIKQGWRVAARTLPNEQLVINSTLFLKRVAFSRSKWLD